MQYSGSNINVQMFFLAVKLLVTVLFCQMQTLKTCNNFFGHSGAAQQALNAILTHYCQQTVFTSSRRGATLALNLSRVFVYLNVNLIFFQLCSALHQLLMETSGSLATKWSSMFTSQPLTLFICHVALSRQCTVGLSELFPPLKTAACYGEKRHQES